MLRVWYLSCAVEMKNRGSLNLIDDGSEFDAFIGCDVVLGAEEIPACASQLKATFF